MTFTLPDLPYEFNALEPHFDETTMHLHHDKHHQTYVNNLNAAIEKHPELADKSVEDLLSDLASVPDDIRGAVRNSGGGHFNHSLFWTLLSPNGGGTPKGPLKEAIEKQFGSFDTFKEEFTKSAMTRFGSGWAWLVEKDGSLGIISTPNQDTPLAEGATPLLALDVWEHAYYLKYQNVRPSYIAAFFEIINWDKVEALYLEAVK